MNIRNAEKRDLETIKTLVKAHVEYEKAYTLDDYNLAQLDEYIFKSDNIKCLVIVLNNEIVGYTTFMKQFSTWSANYYIYIDCLYLNKSARGKGVGAQIMNKIKTYAKSENCKTIQWQTPSFNKKAIGFYKKIGAESTRKERFNWSI